MSVQEDLIERYKSRLNTVFLSPNPYTKPLWEKSEIEQKVKELQRINKNNE